MDDLGGKDIDDVMKEMEDAEVKLENLLRQPLERRIVTTCFSQVWYRLKRFVNQIKLKRFSKYI